MAWVMPVLAGVEKVMQAVTFIQFIQEEAIQSCALSIFLAIRQRQYSTANLALYTLENVLLYHLKTVNDIVGWLAPYSKGAFQDFITATETSIETYKQLLAAAPK
jgi:hypothetical protein